MAGADRWHAPKVLPRALPEALLPKSRPSIGDLVLMPPSHKAAGKVAKVVGHYDAGGACDVEGPTLPSGGTIARQRYGHRCVSARLQALYAHSSSALTGWRQRAPGC